jgi:hypothetical protein
LIATANIVINANACVKTLARDRHHEQACRNQSNDDRQMPIHKSTVRQGDNVT